MTKKKKNFKWKSRILHDAVTIPGLPECLISRKFSPPPSMQFLIVAKWPFSLTCSLNSRKEWIQG